jgi:gamma-glutamylcyclotransferase (GGCT)/AIG2-like uncharacterized protein YtfP
MKVGDNILVYGTLKAGCGANSFMQGRSEFVGDDRINGELYDLGAYPGFKMVGKSEVPGEPVPFHHDGPFVSGEVYRITDEQLPKMLDNYEGYPHLYDRRRMKTESGETVWVYTYANGNYIDYPRIESGSW